MKKLACSLFCVSLFMGVGCDSINHIMTYRSPANFTVAEGDAAFAKMAVAQNVFDNAVVVRSAMTDDVVFDENSYVYDFDTGRSAFKTYNLPLNATNLRIEISVQIGETLFAPSVALINKDHKLIKMFDFNSFEYRPYNDVISESLKFKFNLNNFSAGDNAVSYIVIFTKDEDLKTTTQIVHPAKLYAISHRQKVPEMADPQIPHSRVGCLSVLFSMDAGSIDSVSDFLDALKGPIWGGEQHQYVTDDDDGSLKAAKAVNPNVTVVNPTQTTTPAVTETATKTATDPAIKTTAPVKTMLKETEDMYNNMIITSVKSGDIAKAMQLASEAVQAGSPSANDTLNKALRSYKK